VKSPKLRAADLCADAACRVAAPCTLAMPSTSEQTATSCALLSRRALGILRECTQPAAPGCWLVEPARLPARCAAGQAPRAAAAVAGASAAAAADCASAAEQPLSLLPLLRLLPPPLVMLAALLLLLRLPAGLPAVLQLVVLAAL
jgi:hypothetical protein